MVALPPPGRLLGASRANVIAPPSPRHDHVALRRVAGEGQPRCARVAAADHVSLAHSSVRSERTAIAFTGSMVYGYRYELQSATENTLLWLGDSTVQVVVQMHGQRTDKRTNTTTSGELRQFPRYLILIERVLVDDPRSFDRDSWCGRWRSSNVAALSFSLNTLRIDASTRWHI